jgi:putative endonuclease
VDKGGWGYFLTNRPNGTIYTGVTSDLIKRIGEHKDGKIEGFSRRYYLKRLAWFEFHDEITAAIQRESNIKHWPRQWKVNLIERGNPE